MRQFENFWQVEEFQLTNQCEILKFFVTKREDFIVVRDGGIIEKKLCIVLNYRFPFWFAISNFASLHDIACYSWFYLRLKHSNRKNYDQRRRLYLILIF